MYFCPDRQQPEIIKRQFHTLLLSLGRTLKGFQLGTHSAVLSIPLQLSQPLALPPAFPSHSGLCSSVLSLSLLTSPLRPLKLLTLWFILLSLSLPFLSPWLLSVNLPSGFLSFPLSLYALVNFPYLEAIPRSKKHPHITEAKKEKEAGVGDCEQSFSNKSFIKFIHFIQ